MQVALKSADLTGFVEAREQQIAEVNTFVDLQKNMPDDDEDSSDPEEEGDNSADPDPAGPEDNDNDDVEDIILCKHCKPSSATG